MRFEHVLSCLLLLVNFRRLQHTLTEHALSMIFDIDTYIYVDKIWPADVIKVHIITLLYENYSH